MGTYTFVLAILFCHVEQDLLTTKAAKNNCHYCQWVYKGMAGLIHYLLKKLLGPQTQTH